MPASCKNVGGLGVVSSARWDFSIISYETMLIFFEHTNKTPVCVSKQGFWNLILTMTYSHMGKPHTTIGDASFHY